MPYTSGSGLLAEAITTLTGLSIVMTPQASFSNIEVPVVNNLPLSVTNLSGSSCAVTVTFTVIKFEN